MSDMASDSLTHFRLPPRFRSKFPKFIATFVEPIWYFFPSLLKRLSRFGANWFNHTSWMTVVTPTDHPKSIRNRCVIEAFAIFCWYISWAFCHRTESDLLLLLWTGQKY